MTMSEHIEFEAYLMPNNEVIKIPEAENYECMENGEAWEATLAAFEALEQRATMCDILPEYIEFEAYTEHVATYSAMLLYMSDFTVKNLELADPVVLYVADVKKLM